LRLAARPEAPSGPKACRKRLERNFRQKPIDAGCIQAEYAMASVSPSVPEALLMRPLPALILSLQFGRFADAAQHRTVLPRHRVRRWLRHALLADVQVAEITVRIVGTEEAQSLNRDYRHRDYATNVLTFDYSAAPHVCADLLLCADVVAQEAADQGKPLEDHYAHLLVHGALHAQGLDHETSDADADAMEAQEARILAKLGFANPYA
jgi:probable rRNA maturation factor